MFPIKTILCPTDFSPPSAAAFDLACTLASEQKACLVVLHVVMPASALAYREMVLRGDLDGTNNAIWKELKQVRPDDPAICVEHHLAEGDAGTEILRAAATIKPDLIVMGTHGRTGMGRLLGSVAERVVREADCPVMTLKAARSPASKKKECTCEKAGRALC